MKSINPCSEIILDGGGTSYVQPWVQVQWMNYFRVKQGLPPYTLEEIETLINDLQKQIDERKTSNGS